MKLVAFGVVDAITGVLLELAGTTAGVVSAHRVDEVAQASASAS